MHMTGSQTTFKDSSLSVQVSASGRVLLSCYYDPTEEPLARNRDLASHPYPPLFATLCLSFPHAQRVFCNLLCHSLLSGVTLALQLYIHCGAFVQLLNFILSQVYNIGLENVIFCCPNDWHMHGAHRLRELWQVKVKKYGWKVVSAPYSVELPGVYFSSTHAIHVKQHNDHVTAYQ